ncbi:MAG: DUF3024 domain-containing protein [Bacteroidales bacterium]
MVKDDDSPIVDFNEKMVEQFIESIRPPKELRDKIDISYSYSNNILEIFEVHPQWDDTSKMRQHPRARAKFIKSHGVWRIYWMRASGKWEQYKPEPEVVGLSDFFKIIQEDTYSCFWG